MNAVSRVEMWRGGFRLDISVAAPFVWRCLTGPAVSLFPHHSSGRTDAGGNALVRSQRVAVAPGRRFLLRRNAVVNGARRLAVVDLDATVPGRYPRMMPGRSHGRFLQYEAKIEKPASATTLRSLTARDQQIKSAAW
jgi:hypothetical protein